MADYGIESCDSCGSTNFQIEDGLRVCDNGHVQSGGQQVADDGEEYGAKGKRTVKKKTKATEKILKVYHGHKAYKLFLQAYQLILWKQCYALIHAKALPPELWNIVRDLWTLRVSRLAHRIERPLENDPESQGFSSEAESGAESQQDVEDAARRSRRRAHDSPILLESIGLVYLGILLLRLPIGLAEIYRWIGQEEIPFIRAIRFVPNAMKEKLPGEYRAALDTSTILTADGLQNGVFETSILYSRDFGVSIPSMNFQLILVEHIKRLLLPLEVYPAVLHLKKLVNFSFGYAPPLNNRRTAISQPEAQLMALVIVAVKLIFPFDSDTVKRYPRSLNEAASQRVNWAAWVEARGKAQDEGAATEDETSSLRKGDEIHVQDTDVFNMSGAQLDQYMDWYQRTWAKVDKFGEQASVSKEILDMFPLNPLLNTDRARETEVDELEKLLSQRMIEVHSKTKMRRPISDKEAEQLEDTVVDRPGMHYARYRSVEELEISDVAKSVHVAAAELACLSLRSLVRAVWQTERRITIWRKAKRRADQFGEDMDLEAEGGIMAKLEKMEMLESLGDQTEAAANSSDDDPEQGEDMEMIG